jgi:Xaa-Pro aminopeptidase
MEPSDIERLNRYHRQVWEVISPYLEGDEKEWLKEATREI